MEIKVLYRVFLFRKHVSPLVTRHFRLSSKDTTPETNLFKASGIGLTRVARRIAGPVAEPANAYHE